MKKLFAVILAVALMATMSVTAFAAEIGPGANASQGSTEVSFNVDPTYTVTIPATVELNKVEDNGVVTYENDYTLTAQAGVRLKKGEYIEVTVASDFEMTTQEGATLAYTITKDDAALVDSIVAEFDTDKLEQTATIHVAAADPDYAGEYKDTVTFTVAVKPVPVTTINFTIAGEPYQADAGMTWAQWVASGYNTGEFALDEYDDNPFVFLGYHNVVGNPGATNAWIEGHYVEKTAKIESGLAYVLLPFGA